MPIDPFLERDRRVFLDVDTYPALSSSAQFCNGIRRVISEGRNTLLEMGPAFTE